MHQTVDIAGQADKHAEIGNGFNRAFDFVAFFEVGFKILPWVWLALFHAQADAAFVFVDVQNHHFHFVAQLNDFAWVYIFVGPIHFGNVNQTFDALFNFYECAVVGQVRYFAEQA